MLGTGALRGLFSETIIVLYFGHKLASNVLLGVVGIIGSAASTWGKTAKCGSGSMVAWVGYWLERGCYGDFFWDVRLRSGLGIS